MAQVPVIYRGKDLTFADEAEVDYILPDPDTLTGVNAATIPLKNAVQSPRSFYGARFVDQAVSLKTREIPWVQQARHGAPDRSFDEEFGKAAGALFSDEDGEVEDVTEDEIVLRTPKGVKKIELWNNFPLNRKSFLTHTPVVTKGAKVKAGQILADSNYTKDGTLALGTNARVGVAAYRARGIDDAGVISQSFADRLKGRYCYGFSQEYDDSTKGAKAEFKAAFPGKFTEEQLSKLDDNGVVKQGVTLNQGDPVMLVSKPRTVSSKTDMSGLTRGRTLMRQDASQLWEHHDPGVVVGVGGKNGLSNVYISTEHNVTPGQKLALRPGQKMTVSTILPDDQMPRTSDGRPLDLLLNQMALPSRVNASSIYSILLGKVAEKEGKPIKLPGYLPAGESWHSFVKRKLEEHGLTDKERVFDPRLGKHLDNPVVVGNDYVLALHHTAESKLSSRGSGSYSADEQPVKGGDEGQKAKRFSNLENAATLSSGAYNLMRENVTLRGQKNLEAWQAIRNGREPMRPGKPFVWNKFRALLSGAGFSAKDRNNGVIRLAPQTDADVDAIGAVELDNDSTIDLSTLEAKRGGLFDPALTQTNGWAKITLREPVVHPAFTSQVAKMLGITMDKLRAVQAGKELL
jgi:DNA-directed RNA polymerase subunit beta